MSEEKTYDNSGIFFVNRKKTDTKHPDFSGSIKVNGIDYWLYIRAKFGDKGEFWTVSVAPKEKRENGATANRTVTTAGTSSLSINRSAPPAEEPPALDDEIPF